LTGGVGVYPEIDPLQALTKREPLTSAIDAYRAFAERRPGQARPGWVKVELGPLRATVSAE